MKTLAIILMVVPLVAVIGSVFVFRVSDARIMWLLVPVMLGVVIMSTLYKVN